MIVKNACTTLCTVYTKMVFTGRNNDVGYLMRIFASQELQSKYYHLHMWGEVECKPLLAKMSTALAQSGKKISMTRVYFSNWWGSSPVIGGIRVGLIFSFLCCVVFFVFRLSLSCVLCCPLWPVSLDCQPLIAPSVFSKWLFTFYVCVVMWI